MNKARYDILDALRGVAALCVLGTHLCEAVAFAAGNPEQDFYHGFLAVDFFFVLSGFVMGYAYDNRWDKMTTWDFCKRRLIRLHPMAVMGVCLGLIAFAIQGFTNWSGEVVPASQIALCFFLSLFMLPSPASVEVRGNTEIFPLNGPHWSLFFEYVGSLIYALALRRMSTKILKVWVAVSAVALACFGIFGPEGTIGCGWSSQPMNFLGGALRLLFAYPAGLLLARLFNNREQKLKKLPVFLISAIMLIILLCVPCLHEYGVYYQLFCVICGFPLIVWFGAHGVVEGFSKKVANYLGRLSYPLYAIHYPLIYLYIHWINTGQHPFGQEAWKTPAAIAIIAITTATVLFLFYDEPLRKRLSNKFLKKQ